MELIANDEAQPLIQYKAAPPHLQNASEHTELMTVMASSNILKTYQEACDGQALHQ